MPGTFHGLWPKPPITMNDEPKSKRVRELLQDITARREASDGHPRGFVRTDLVDRITFFASIICLLLVAIALVGMIWDFTNEVFGLRSIATLAVVMLTLFAFRSINAQFE